MVLLHGLRFLFMDNQTSFGGELRTTGKPLIHANGLKAPVFKMVEVNEFNMSRLSGDDESHQSPVGVKIPDSDANENARLAELSKICSSPEDLSTPVRPFKIKPLNKNVIPRQKFKASPPKGRVVDVEAVVYGVQELSIAAEKLQRTFSKQKDMQREDEIRRRKFNKDRLGARITTSYAAPTVSFHKRKKKGVNETKLRIVPQAGRHAEITTSPRAEVSDPNSCTPDIEPQVLGFGAQVSMDQPTQIVAGEVAFALKSFGEQIGGIKESMDSFKDLLEKGEGKLKIEHSSPTLDDMKEKMVNMSEFAVVVIVVVVIVAMKPKTPLERGMAFVAISGLLVTRFGFQELLQRCGLLSWFQNASPVDETQPQAGIFGETDLEEITTIVTSFINLYVVGHVGKEILDPKEFLKVTTQLSRATPTVANITKGIGLVISFISRCAGKAMGWEHFGPTGYEFIDSFFKESHEVIEAWASKELFNRESSVARVKGLIHFGEDVMCKLPMSGKQANVRFLLIQQIMELKKIRDSLLSSGYKFSGVRSEPTSLMMRGSPGVFKSQAMQHVGLGLCARTLNPEDFKKFKESPMAVIYNRQHESVYWDGYTADKKVILFDDCLQCKDVAGTPDNEVMNVIRAQNIFENILHMANLNDKGTTQCRPDFILATTNMMNIQLESIHDARAFTRRFDLVVDVSPRQEYCENPKASILDRKFDRSKLPLWTEEECAGHPEREGLVGTTKAHPSFCEFHVQKLTRDGLQFEDAGYSLNFEQLMDRLIEIDHVKKGWGKGFLAGLQETVSSQRRKYEEESVQPESGHAEPLEEDPNLCQLIDSIRAMKPDMPMDQVRRRAEIIRDCFEDSNADLYFDTLRRHGSDGWRARDLYVTIVPLQGHLVMDPGSASFQLFAPGLLKETPFERQLLLEDGFVYNPDNPLKRSMQYVAHLIQMFCHVPDVNIRGTAAFQSPVHKFSLFAEAIETYFRDYEGDVIDYMSSEVSLEYFSLHSLTNLIAHFVLYHMRAVGVEVQVLGRVLFFKDSPVSQEIVRIGIEFKYGPPLAHAGALQVGSHVVDLTPQAGWSEDGDPDNRYSDSSDSSEGYEPMYRLSRKNADWLDSFKLSDYLRYGLYEAIIRAVLLQAEINGQIVDPDEIVEALTTFEWNEWQFEMDCNDPTDPAPFVFRVWTRMKKNGKRKVFGVSEEDVKSWRETIVDYAKKGVSALCNFWLNTYLYTLATGAVIVDEGFAWAFKDPNMRKYLGTLLGAFVYGMAAFQIAKGVISMIFGNFSAQSNERSGKTKRAQREKAFRRNPKPQSFISSNKNLCSVIEMVSLNHLFVVHRPRTSAENEAFEGEFCNMGGPNVVMGYAMAIGGRLMLMPYHFWSQIGSLVEDNELKANDLITFKFVNNGCLHWSITAKDFFEGAHPDQRADKQDLILIEMPKNYQPVRKITKHFATEKQQESYTKCDAILYVGDRRATPELVNGGPVAVANANSVVAVRNKDIIIPDSAEWDEFVIEQVYRYRADTDFGDCGSPLYVNDSQKTASIIGMHVAGSSSERVGFSSVITREWLEKYIEDIGHKYEVESMETQFGWTANPVNIEQTGDVQVVGQIEPHSMAPGRMMGSAIRRSPLHDTYFKSPNAPARLGPFTDKEGNRIDPFDIAFQGYCPGFVYIPEKVVEKATRSLFDYLTHNSTQGCEKCVLTFEKAVLGDGPGSALSSIPRSTSSGYPYNVTTKPSNKVYFFGDGMDFDLSTPEAQELKREVHRVELLAMQNIRSNHIFTDTLKDETRKKAKVFAGKTRMFSGSPLVYFILCRMYFGSFSKWMIMNKLQNGVSIGVNEFSSQWDLAARLLNQFGTGRNKGAGDFEGLDKRELPIFHQFLGEMVNEWYGEDPVGNRVRSILLLDLTNSLHVNRGILMYWHGSMPSGHFLTAMFNSLTVQLMFRVCWHWAVECRLEGSHDFNKHVYLLVLGDDNVFSVHPEYVDYFNEKVIAEQMVKLGHVYTSADKETVLTEKLHDLTEVTFLKRRWVYDERTGRYVGPLALDSVLDIANWVKKGGNPIGDTENNVQVVLHELALHGKSVFDYWCSKILAAIDNCPGMQRPESSSFERYYQQVMMRGESYWMDMFNNNYYRSFAPSEDLPASDYDVERDNTPVIQPQSGRLGIGRGAALFSVTSRMALAAFPYYPGNRRAQLGLAGSYAFISAATTNTAEGENPPGKEGLFSVQQTEEVSGSDLNQNTTSATNDGGVTTSVRSYLPLSNELLNSARTQVANEIASFLAKPKIVSTGTLNTTDTFATAILSKIVPSDLINVNDIWGYKIQGTLGFRGELHLTLQINGNRFQQGRYMLVFCPNGGSVGNTVAFTRAHMATLTEVTQLPRVELDVNCDTEGTLVIPHINVQGWTAVKLLSTYGNIGTVALLAYSPLVSPAGSSSCSYTLFAHYEKVEITLPTMPQSGRPYGRVRRNPNRPADAEAESGGLGPIQSAALKVGMASKILSGIPLLSSVAQPVSWASDIVGRAAGAFGWARPRNEGPTVYMSKQIMHRFTNVDAQDNSTKLALFDRNEVEDIPNFAGGDVDELALNYVAGISAYYTGFSWSTASAADAVLLTQPISPRLFTRNTTQATTAITHLTPLAFVSSFFTLWRGTIRFTFKLVKTEFHSGRLLAAFTPYDYANIGSAPVVNLALSQYLHRTIIDVRNGNEFVIDVPYTAFAQYRATYGNDSFTGKLTLFVLNPLVAPANVSSSISVLVEVSAGEDFEWAGPAQPSGDPVFQWTPQSGRIVPQAGRKDCTITEESVGGARDSQSLMSARAAIGERVLSFRSLLKRFNRVLNIPDGQTTDQFYSCYPPQISVRQIDSTPAVVATVMRFDTYDRVASCYAMIRGSMRWKAINMLKSHDPHILAMSYPRSGVGVSVLNLNTIQNGAQPIDNTNAFVSVRSYAFGRGDATGGIEVEFPFYNQYPATATADVTSTGATFSVTNKISIPNASNSGSRYMGCFQALNYDSDPHTKPEFFRAVGEDFSAGFFVSTLPVIGWDPDSSA